MEYFQALQLISLNNVLNPDSEYRLRQIFRWYSKTFHTPLHMVLDLPLEDVLLSYFESVYEEMDEEDREEQKKLLLETDEDRFQRLLNEERRSYDDEQFMKDMKKEQEKKKKISKDEKKPPIIANSVKKIREPEIGDGLKNAPPKEEVKIVFVEDNLLEEESDSTFFPSKKKSEW